MSSSRSLLGRVGWVAAFLFIAVGAQAAQTVLFPSPLHITREVTDPITGSKAVIDEYCHGNRVVAVSGRRTSIVEYDKSRITVIDFGAGTYSHTKFEQIAQLLEKTAPAAAVTAASREAWKVEKRGGRVVASRPGELVEIEKKDAQEHQVIRMTVDRQLKLSRAAVEALTGLGYPNPRAASADAVLGALRSNEQRAVGKSGGAVAEDEYHLPLEYASVVDIGGETLETRNVVVRVGNELAPPDLLAIPPGATLVESDAVAARRMLDDLDRVSKPKSAQ